MGLKNILAYEARSLKQIYRKNLTIVEVFYLKYILACIKISIYPSNIHIYKKIFYYLTFFCMLKSYNDLICFIRHGTKKLFKKKIWQTFVI